MCIGYPGMPLAPDPPVWSPGMNAYRRFFEAKTPVFLHAAWCGPGEAVPDRGRGCSVKRAHRRAVRGRPPEFHINFC